MFNNLSLRLSAFLQATGLVVYLGLLTLFFNHVLPRLDKSAEAFAPIVMLLLFVISAMISGSLLLGRAGLLFWEKKRQESFQLVAWTLGWCVAYFAFFILLLLAR